MSYRENRAWADQYLPQVKAIVGPHLLMPAPLERDLHEAADMVVLNANGLTIGVRLRRRERGFWASHPHQFTLRYHNNNSTTELAKIVAGWGDWFFYGHAGDGIVDPWMLLDLDGLREAFQRDASLLRSRHRRHDNGDGTKFMHFDRDMLPSYVTIATSQSAQHDLFDPPPMDWAEALPC